MSYDVFISYRHQYPDTKVAKQLHKLLERFRLPKSLAEESGHAGRWKVFMDDFELPATPDLSQTIKAALDSSRFLVLLCSTSTPESDWVKKEVLTFAGKNGWDHILPILIEGTPESSFPKPVLEYKNIQYLDVSGEPNHFRINASIRHSRAWFCHRIAGCRHDALRRALRSRDVRRAAIYIIAPAVLMLTLSLYLLNLRDSAQASTLEAQRLDEQNRISLQNTQAQRLVYEEAMLSAERAVQDADENALWVRLAETESALDQGQLFPAAALAKEFLLEPGITGEMAEAAQSVVERAKPSGYMTEVFSFKSVWTGMQFTPDSKTLLIVADDGTVRSYPTDTYLRRALFQDFVPIDRRIQISDSGRLAAYFTHQYPDQGQPNLFMLDPQTLEAVHSISLTYDDNERNKPGFQFDFFPGTETIYVTAALEQAYKIDEGEITALPELPIRDRYQGIYPLSETLFLLFNGWWGEEWPQIPSALYDLDTGEETLLDEKTMLEGSLIDCSPDGRFLAYRTEMYETPLYVFDRGSGEILFFVDEMGCKDVAFSPDSSLMAVSRYENDVEIYETEGFTLVRTYRLPDAWARKIAFLDGNGKLAFLEEFERVLSLKLMDAATGAILGEYDPGAGQFAEELLLSPDGTQLVSRTDAEIKVWLVGEE